MSTVRELRRALGIGEDLQGKVVAVSGGQVKVATARGLVSVAGSGVKRGDVVVVRDGRLLPQATRPLTVYDL